MVNVPLLTAVIGVLVFIAAFTMGNALFGRSSKLEQRVRQTDNETPSGPRFSLRNLTKRTEQIIKPLGEMIPRSPEEMSRQERRLVTAGFRRKDAPVLFYGVKIALAIFLVIA